VTQDEKDDQLTERLEEFDSAFYDKFHVFEGESVRWGAFRYIAQHLLEINEPFILETGCLRQIDNWMGDGQSTRIWDWIAHKTNGTVGTVDLNEHNAKAARSVCSDHTDIKVSDSIAALRTDPEYQAALNRTSLLYLDSYDYSPQTKHLSALHHIGELACVYDKLPSGCLIAVDDCISDTEGKHLMVKAFFDMMGVEPVLKSYVTVWRKP